MDGSLETVRAILGKKLYFFSFIVGLCLTVIFISLFLERNTDFSDAPITGSFTSTIYPERDDHRIHCSEINYQECLNSLERKASKNNILWLSNSQLHAINQLKPEETNAVGILYDSLMGTDSHLIAVSQPNASFQEHLVIFEFLESKTQIDTLIISLIFDDLREDGLRSDIAQFLKDQVTYNRLDNSETGKKIIKSNNTTSLQDKEYAGISNTFQEIVEKNINNFLSENSPAWEARPEIRGYIFLDVLYKFRNYIFNISPSSKRKMIPESYDNNLAALSVLFESAKARNIEVIAYIAPFPQVADNPYDTEQYNLFKSDIKVLATDNNITYYNFEDIVPLDRWGFKASTSYGTEKERDFMHFQFQGHQALANSLSNILREEN